MRRKDQSDKLNSSHYNRRNILKVIGGGIGLTTLPTVAAKRSKQTATSAEISTTIDDLRSLGEIEKIKQLCEEHGVKYSHASTSLPTLSSPDPDKGTIEPQDELNKGDSGFDLLALLDRTDPQGQEIYSASVAATIVEDDGNIQDGASPFDAMAITWSDTYFQPVSQTSGNFYPYDPDGNLLSYRDYYRYGVGGNVDDNKFQDRHPSLDGNAAEAYVSFATDLEKLQYGNKFNINAEYLHNWNFGGNVYLVDTFNIGPFGINFSGTNVDTWRKERTVKA